MLDSDLSNVFAPILTKEELDGIPVNTAQKIFVFVSGKFDELISSRALLETGRRNAESNLEELKNEYTALSLKNDDLRTNYESASNTVTALESQISTFSTELKKLQETCNRLEQESADYRHQRNLAVDERAENLNMLKRRTTEIERLNEELETISKQYETAVNAKCEALAQADEVASMKITLEYKEKRIEQERTLLNGQLESLTEELQEKTEELLNMRRDNTSRCIQLETKLSERTQELGVALDQVKAVTEVNNKLSERIEEMSQNLLAQRESEAKMHESYMNEIDGKTKLANVYKEMCEESEQHAQQLKDALSEVQELLKEATEKYGDLETKHKENQLAHDEIILKKNECIALLKSELETANEILEHSKESRIHNDIAELSTTAAKTSTILKSGMTFTELYSKYVAVSEKLLTAQEENSRLNNYVTSIVREIEEKGPFVKKLKEDYGNMLDANEELKHANDTLLDEIQQLREANAECRRLEGITARENARLQKDVSDLGRQVCHLLHEVEQCRTGSSTNSPDMDFSDSVSSADIITKKLVTFNDIQELQQTNKKLLSLVRELTERHEEAEAFDPAAISNLRNKLDNMRETQNDLLEERDRQNKMMETLKSQRDMYKNLYTQAVKAAGDEIPMQLERPYTLPDHADTNKSRKDSEGDMSHSESEKIRDLENQIATYKKHIEQLKIEKDSYKEERNANDKMLQEQIESMRKEIKDLNQMNCKLVAQTEVNEERFKILKNNCDIYKIQVGALEKQNSIYTSTISKQEQTITYLKDETMQCQTRLSKAEVMLSNLQKENALIKDSESRLLKERESMKQKTHSQNLIHSNLELIKATLERTDSESKLRAEARLDEAHRECAALRMRLQEEQDRFRQLSEHLQAQTNTANERMQEEKAEADRLRKELHEVREELIRKTTQIEDLTRKLKLSILAIPETNVDGKKVRQLEQQLADAQSEVETLKSKLQTTKAASEQYFSVAEEAEKQIKIIVEREDAYKNELEKQQQTINSLQEKCAELQGEMSIQMDDNDITNTGLPRATQLQEELSVRTMDLGMARQQLENARSECKTILENLKAVESKYTREVMLHSADLQVLSAMKEELEQARDEVNQIKQSREQALEEVHLNKTSWEIQEQRFLNEKQELESRFNDVDKQNSLLLDQIQSLNTQLTIIQAHASAENLNSSATADTSFNKSMTEDECKSSEQLLKIIKFLRQEKDIAVNKSQILEEEHLRVKAQLDMVTKQLNEAKEAMENARQNSEVSVITAAKHAEVLRKVETLNAITDSNRALRQERDALVAQINELRSRTLQLETEMAPLQESNIELNNKSEAMQTENISLRAECTRWRQRANILIEKSNRTSPEDWKKLQNEKETLSKQLTIEKSNVVKLNDDVNTLRQEKLKLEDQLKSLRAQNNAQTEELTRLNENLQSLTTQLVEAKRDLDLLQTEKQKKEDEANSNINELKNNLMQIRKIARRYKTQFEDQTKEFEALKKEMENKQVEQSELAQREEQMREENRTDQERINLIEQNHKQLLEQCNQEKSNVLDENENFKKEIESLKQSSQEKEERFKALFKNAKDRIVTLTEHNKELKEELKNSGKSTGETSETGGNRTLLAKIESLLKEKDDMIEEHRLQKEKLTTDVEALTQKVNQLQRQLGLQQGSKPSTSSGPQEKPVTEPPTANIKPMAGHSTNTQTQSVPIQPWRNAGETPLASIRPMSAQLRTVAVLPTSQSPSAVMVPPQQQSSSQVHTTGSSTVESLSSSPTSSHTDYVPATSSASSAVLGVRQVAVPPSQSSQDTEEDDGGMQVHTAPQQQAVALVLPRVEPPAPSGSTQEQGTSSTSSSNTVTTTQAGLKRQREADTEACQADEQNKTTQQSKRTRIQQQPGTSSDSSLLEVEYQVPTSSQRDHDDDNVIVVESDEENAPDEGEGADDEPDDPDTEGYDMEGMEHDNYEVEPDCQEEEDEEGGNEVEVIDDSSEVPNQSEPLNDSLQEENGEQQQSEAISSGTDGTGGITFSQASTSATPMSMPLFSRTRPVAPLSSRPQQSHLMLPHSLEETADDSIVPSTPTLYVPRRSDGFGEAVSSPHVPTSGRFTFSESAPPSTSGQSEVVPEQTLEMHIMDENSTGRSVPSTPLQSSPQEGLPIVDDQISQQDEDLPLITVSGAEDDQEGPEVSGECSMGPPAVAGTSSDSQSDQVEEMLEGDDEVSSEGEKQLAPEEGEEEGREAEASPTTNSRPSNRGQVARRSMRSMNNRGFSQRSGPTPILWNQQQQNRQDGRGRGNNSPNFNQRIQRRPRGRSPYRRY